MIFSPAAFSSKEKGARLVITQNCDTFPSCLLSSLCYWSVGGPSCYWCSGWFLREVSKSSGWSSPMQMRCTVVNKGKSPSRPCCNGFDEQNKYTSFCCKGKSMQKESRDDNVRCAGSYPGLQHVVDLRRSLRTLQLLTIQHLHLQLGNRLLPDKIKRFRRSPQDCNQCCTWRQTLRTPSCSCHHNRW